MGFAVVAGEVRNLAQRSAQAAKETSAKIENCIGKSTVGCGISNKVSASLHDILGRVRKVDDLVADIANSAREQNQGISQVNIAVTQMDKITQANAASAEESASAAEELSAQANTLLEVVKHLTDFAGIKTNAATAGSKAAENGGARPVSGSFLDRSPHTNGRSPFRQISTVSGSSRMAHSGQQSAPDWQFQDFTGSAD
jgi:methyl-accepting chemotaxis protein